MFKTRDDRRGVVTSGSPSRETRRYDSMLVPSDVDGRGLREDGGTDHLRTVRHPESNLRHCPSEILPGVTGDRGSLGKGNSLDLNVYVKTYYLGTSSLLNSEDSNPIYF